MTPLHSLCEDAQTICARVVNLSNDFLAANDLDGPARKTISGLCFQARDLLDEAISQAEKSLRGKGYRVGGFRHVSEILPGVVSAILMKSALNMETQSKRDISRWAPSQDEASGTIEISRGVARRLALVVRLGAGVWRCIHPDHAEYLLTQLGQCPNSEGTTQPTGKKGIV